MWNTQNAPKIKVVDGVSDGEVGLELHMKNGGERITQEAITDDDVFKELINIVMDVFSSKSEKCMLTFELPVESEVLKEISPEAVENGTQVSSSASKSDILIPLRDSKSFRRSMSRRKRKWKVPMAKTSKYKMKKKFKKRLNPVVQTALRPKPGFTDLERLLWMHPKQSHLTDRERDDRHGRVTEPAGNTADGWKDAAERDALLDKVSTLKEKMTYPPQLNSINSGAFGNLYSEFKDILEVLEQLAHSQQWKPVKLPYGELSYHLEEIQCHIGAIRNSLQDSESMESVNTMEQFTSTESTVGPKRNNIVGVKLIRRIGAKTGQKSRSKKPRKGETCKQKLKSTQEAGLKEILKDYQRVKKEETEIVQVLLGKLGFHKGCSDRRYRKRRPKTPAQPHSVTVERVQCRQAAKNTRDIQEAEATDKETQNEQRNNTVSAKAKQLLQMSLPEDKRDSKQRNERNHKDMHRKNRKRREHKHREREITTKRSRDCRKTINANNKKHSPIILYGRPSPLSIGSPAEQNTDNFRKGKRGNAMEFVEIQPHPGGENSEDRMMRRIQSAAKRLEYMHSLVEKKLNRLSKQQKELNRKITGKEEGDYTYTPRESQSNEEHQGSEPEQPKRSLLNLSTEIEELIFQPYRYVKLDEPKDLKETLSCYVNEPQGVEEISTNGILGRHSLSTLETRGNLNQEQPQSESGQNYICNYVMEMRGKGFEVASTGSMENQHGSEEGDAGNMFSSCVLTNEFQENSSSNGHNNDNPASSLLSITTKENEGEIIEESLFAKRLPSSKNVQKPTGRKKKKRVIHTPICAMS